MAVNEHVRATIMDGLRSALTEERTDLLIQEILDRLSLPFWLRWLPIGTVLDRLLPDVLLNAIDSALRTTVGDADPRVG